MRPVAPFLLSILCCGCAIEVEVARGVADQARDAGADAGAPVMAWGDYAATLDVRDCAASDPVLVVSTAAAELDGGKELADPSAAGPTLSLIEAMWIASNRGGPHTIRFDPQVFPVEAPASIAVSNGNSFPHSSGELVPLCVDGRGAGVQIVWDLPVDRTPAPNDVPTLGTGSLWVGLELLGLREPINVNGAQLAGCRLHAHKTGVKLGNAGVLGPGMVIWGESIGVQVNRFREELSVVDCFFGWDPLRAAPLATNIGLDLAAPTVISGNVFGAVRLAANVFGDTDRTIFLDNRFGVDGGGTPIGAPSSDSSWVQVFMGNVGVGPGNTFRLDGGDAVRVLTESRVELTRNSLLGRGAGLRYEVDAPPFAPPTITAATTAQVQGTCSRTGRVEVFSGEVSAGERFEGEVDCGPWEPWQLPVDLEPGRRVTATLTDDQLRTAEYAAPVIAG